MRGSSEPTDRSRPLLPCSALCQISLFLSLSFSLSGSWLVCRGGVRLTFRLSRFPQCQLRHGNEFPLSRGLLHLIWSGLAASPLLQEFMDTPTFFFFLLFFLNHYHAFLTSFLSFSPQCKHYTLSLFNWQVLLLWYVQAFNSHHAVFLHYYGGL